MILTIWLDQNKLNDQYPIRSHLRNQSEITKISPRGWRFFRGVWQESRAKELLVADEVMDLVCNTLWPRFVDTNWMSQKLWLRIIVLLINVRLIFVGIYGLYRSVLDVQSMFSFCVFVHLYFLKSFRCRIPFILPTIVCLNKPTSTCNVCLTSTLFYFEPYAFDVHVIVISIHAWMTAIIILLWTIRIWRTHHSHINACMTVIIVQLWSIRNPLWIIRI